MWSCRITCGRYLCVRADKEFPGARLNNSWRPQLPPDGCKKRYVPRGKVRDTRREGGPGSPTFIWSTLRRRTINSLRVGEKWGLQDWWKTSLYATCLLARAFIELEGDTSEQLINILPKMDGVMTDSTLVLILSKRTLLRDPWWSDCPPTSISAPPAESFRGSSVPRLLVCLVDLIVIWQGHVTFSSWFVVWLYCTCTVG